MAQIDIPAVPNFDPHNSSVSSQSWNKWLRAFELYAAGRGVRDTEQKKALLLHCAGTAVQDIFFTLELKQGADAYERATKTLNSHFQTKVNVPYERYCFRQLSQDNDESVEEFITRLRQQAALCEFANVDEQIRDQVIEKCKSNKLRAKLLEKGHALTLNDLRTTASTFEMTERQVHHMTENVRQKTGVNSVGHQFSARPRGGRSSGQAQGRGHHASGAGGGHQSYSRGQDGARDRGNYSSGGRPGTSGGSRFSCYRCGREGHFAKDQCCPARGKTCNKCGKMGHFSQCCKSQNYVKGKSQYTRKNQQSDRQMPNQRRGHIRNVNRQESESNRNDYDDTDNTCNDSVDDVFTFCVNNVHAHDTVNVQVDKQDIEMIVDSGTTVNMIDTETWEKLKANRIKCKSEKTSQKLYAYGSKEPLKLKGKFTTNVSVAGNHSVQAEFYVMDGKGPALLGRHTAEKLGVLKIQVPTQTIGSVKVEEYAKCFDGIGKLDGYQLHLYIDQDVSPVAQNMYRVPYSLRDKVSAKLDELESMDIIERVEGPSEWVSPVIVVPKPNGDIRLCVDMRQANRAIKRERHPIPTVDEVLYQMNGSTVFSKLDMKYGYHQIELDDESKEITTFVTHKGLYRYKRLMFGINAAPEKYQHVVSQVLSGCEGVANISDDIVVYGRTREEHDKRLDRVLRRLSEKNLTLNKEKCTFGADEITFMGHTLTRNGVQPTNDRIKALKEAGKPKNAAEVRSFLGLVNFSARYIPNLATVAEPLRRLVRKNEPFIWGPEQEESFTRLTECLTKGDALGYFKLDAEKTQLVTDASNVGLGAVLLQTYNGETRTISYASRTLTDAEKRYSTTEKEALAVVWACQKFHTYLYGVEFQLITDHKPLEVLYGPRSRPNARIERWVMKLMSYSFTVVYQPGRYNIADILSRQPVKSQTEDAQSTLHQDAELYVRWVAMEATPNALSTREVEEASKDDEELVMLRESMMKDQWGKDTAYFSAFKHELSCIGYLVLRGTRILIPKKLRQQCVQLAHTGHLGIVGTKQRLRTKVWWPHMEKDVDRFVKSCHGCQITASMPSPEPVKPTPLPTGPWQVVGIDLLGPLPSKDYIFVAVDYYSRYYEIDVMKDISSDRIIEALEKMFVHHGLPITITSDNGPQFVSEKFEQYLKSNRIEHRRVTPLHPAANGEVERQNRSLMKRIRIAQAENKDWKKEIRTYMFAYRTTPHSVTGVTPAEMMFQRKLRTRLPELEEKTRLDEEARDRDAIQKERNRMYIDEKRGAKERHLQEGDEVLVRQTRGDKMSTPYHTEPYTLVRKNGNSVIVQSPEGVQYKRNSTHVQKYNRTPEYNTDMGENGNSDTNTQTQTRHDTEQGNATVTSGRPVRERKQPKRFDEFLLYH